MKPTLRLLAAGPILMVWTAALHAQAENPKAIDLSASMRMFDSHFGNYGFTPFQTIIKEKQSLRFKLPPVKGVDQTGLYSYFALAGDFEFSATYEVLALTPPKSGYGVSFGIAIEAKEKGTTIQLARGQQVNKTIGAYILTKGIRGDDGKMDYSGEDFPASAPSGRLVIRRVKNELICLTAEKPGDEPEERWRFPFTDGTVRKIRLFADTGGSPTTLDCRLANIKVSAGEITGGVPQSEASIDWVWWITWSTFAVFGVVLFTLYRRERRQEYGEEPEAPAKKKKPLALPKKSAGGRG